MSFHHSLVTKLPRDYYSNSFYFRSAILKAEKVPGMRLRCLQEYPYKNCLSTRKSPWTTSNLTYNRYSPGCVNFKRHFRKEMSFYRYIELEVRVRQKLM